MKKIKLKKILENILKKNKIIKEMDDISIDLKKDIEELKIIMRKRGYNV